MSRNTIRRSLAALVALALTAGTSATPGAPGAEGKKALDAEELWKMARVSDPQVSPDGARVAFTVTWYSMSKNRGYGRIYLDSVSKDEQAVPFTNPGAAGKDWSPRWSPDGKTLAFLSTRTGAPQIWKVPIAGGEAVQATEFPAGVNEFTWSPDGKSFAFASDVPPECGADLPCLAKKAAEEAGPVQAKVIDGLLYRVWNSWRVGIRSHVFVIPSDGSGPARDLTPGDHDTPPVDLGSAHDFVWSPDGKEIAFVTNPTETPAWNTQNDVFTVPASGGEAVRASESEGSDSAPLYSPDGKWLAFLSMERPGFEADRKRLAVMDRATGKIRIVDHGMDLSIDDFAWAPDGKSVIVTAAREAREPVWRIDVASGKATMLVADHVNGSVRVTPDGKSIVFAQQALDKPVDLWRLDLAKKGAAPVRITWFNSKRLDALEMNPMEEFWFEGANGDRVHAGLLKPPHFDPSRKYPVVFMLHGGPQGAWTDDFHYRWNAQMFAAPGYVVVMVNFHGSAGYGQAFLDSVSKSWGTLPYEDVMKAIDHVAATYPFADCDRLGAAGASYGGYLANWIVANSDRFDAVVSHSGVYDLRSMYGSTEELWFPEWEYDGTPWENPEMYEKFSPSFFIDGAKTPTLVTHGQNDFRVPVTQGMQMFSALQRLGVPSRFVYFPDEDHFIQKPQNARLWWSEVLGWLGKYLKP